jgi:SAM-dependent methyltransferase
MDIDENDYRRRHTGDASVATGYDERLFRQGTYESMLWERERALLDRMVDGFVPRRDAMLDFACGTARVLAHLEDRFGDATGLDISPDMLANARAKLKRARLVCGDATRQPDVVKGPFDLITAFRFFLNAQPALRDEAMHWLVSKLCDETSVLFFNIHGNRFSTRQLVARIKKLQGKEVHWMSRGEVERLVARHGLEVVDWQGLIYVDKFVYKHVPRFVWRALEGTFELLHAPRGMSVNLYFTCRRAPPPP